MTRTTFALVHGAWHDGGCWDELAAELERRGHLVVAPSLPAWNPRAGVKSYARAVGRALRRAGEDVVLVGHSLGGLTVPVVAAARPVRRLVYLCGLIPVPGASMIDQERAEPDIFVEGFGDELRRDRLGRSHWPEPRQSIPWLYGRCPPAAAAAAAARLRAQGRTPSEEAWPLLALPQTPADYVVCREDRALNPDWSRRAASERLGVRAHELDADHSPFLSAPAELASLLERLAAQR